MPKDPVYLCPVLQACFFRKKFISVILQQCAIKNFCIIRMCMHCIQCTQIKLTDIQRTKSWSERVPYNEFHCHLQLFARTFVNNVSALGQ
jgi:hypothetical protein